MTAAGPTLRSTEIRPRFGAVSSVWTGLLNLVWPERCPQCGNAGQGGPTRPFCRSCWESIVRHDGPRCSVCGRTLSSEHGIRCGPCMEQPPSYDRLLHFGLYGGALRQAVHLLKYRHSVHLAGPLAAFMAPLVPEDATEICPVPLHPRRLRQREYNQSLLLAARLAQDRGVPLVPDRVRRTRHTLPQVGLSRMQRRKNLRGSMAVPDLPVGRGSGTIVVVDDVCTTGATVSEAARALKAAGAGKVIALVLARDERGSDAVLA